MQRGIAKLCAATIVVMVLLTGCSAQSGGPVTFQMHWAWSASTAGFAIAEEDGQLEGVDAVEGRGSGTAVQLVASGQADIGVADAVAIMQQIDQGAPLVVVATMNQVTNIAMQVLDSSGIKNVEDLRGKTVAVPQGGAYAFLFPLFLEMNGLSESDVEVANVPFESMVASLLEGNVDAIVGGQDSHVALAQQGAEFSDFLFADYGVDAVAHSIFTTEDYLENHPDEVKEFVAASLKSFGEARADPKRAVEAIKAQTPDTDTDAASVELEFLLPLMCAADAQFIGRTEPEHWRHSIDLLTRAELIPAGLDPNDFVSYDYLPDEADLISCN